MKYTALANYIQGSYVPASPRSQDVTSPVNGELLTTVPLANESELQTAIESAKQAFPGWSDLTLRQRCDVFYRIETYSRTISKSFPEFVTKKTGKRLPSPKRRSLRQSN